MPLSNGTRLGPYEIVAPAGAGGMGEVYRATDTRLDRVVAVKILPQQLSTSSEIRERFEREARSVSKLSHPHICILHDVGREGDLNFIVMEYLEGETLEQRLLKGPLPPDQVLRYAIQIADALDKAHRQGVIHRDLKPSNIMLTKSGAKLLDFGLAKQLEAVPVAAALTELTAPGTNKLTTEGTILGTFQYMAPEQLEGADADQRTDIFALGEVMYEMATGHPPFKGRTKASLIASILSSEPPPIAAVQPLTPPALDRVVRICLSKDPAERFQSAHDLKLQLEWIAEGGSQAGVPVPVAARRKRREWLAWATAAVLAVAGLAAGWLLRAPAPPPVLRTTVPLPAGIQLQNEGSLVLSPDGRKLAIAASSGEKLQIFIRPLDSMALQPLAGTDGATYPFWSPDSEHLGFFADGKLKRVPAGGGTVQTICDAADGRGAAWSENDVIVFTPGPYDGLFTVPAAGGKPAELTKVEGGARSSSHRVPVFLPGGKHALFFTLVTIGGSGEGINAVSLADGKVTKVSDDRSAAIYVDPGYLLFVREGNLMAQRFDAAKLKLVGDPTPIAEDVQFNAIRRTGTYTAARNGLLLYQAGGGGGKAQMAWIEPLSGKELGKVGPPSGLIDIALSRDGKRLIGRVPDARAGVVSLWLYELDRDVLTRFTFGEGIDVQPLWTPDGVSIIYSSNRSGNFGIYQKPVSGAGQERELVSGEGEHFAGSVSYDGRLLFYQVRNRDTKGWDIWVLPLDGSGKPSPVLQGVANETSPTLSPDGKWLAYISDESGRPEGYLVPFPSLSGKWQLTTGGGSSGGFDGRSRFSFVGIDQKFYRVEVRSRGAEVEIGKPQVLLGGQSVATWRGGTATWDGERILGLFPVEQSRSSTINLVSNWSESLKKK